MNVSCTDVAEVHAFSSRVLPLDTFNVLFVCIAVWAFVKLVGISHGRVRTTELRGPPRLSFVYGAETRLAEARDSASLYEMWACEYGAAYQVSMALGKRRIVLHDPKAIAHVQSKQSWTYVRIPMMKNLLGQMFGAGILWSEGERHSRQRKSLAPAFGIAAIRRLTPIFYDSANKTKKAWSALIQSRGGNNAIVEVQRWMNYISIDTIGLASFSHNFGTLDGNHDSITEIRDALDTSPPSSALAVAFSLFAQALPIFVQIPTPRARSMWKLSIALEEISNALMARTKHELDMGVAGDEEERSIIGLLIKAGSAEPKFPKLSSGEVLSQMKALLVAGFGTVSVSLTWTLIELARHADVQTKLRNELLEHHPEPSYDQLVDGLPYLDAVVHETLRLHAPIRETIRQATEDDVIPLSEPVYDRSGQPVETLSIAKGTLVSIPIASINRADDVWGDDAKAFLPDRWLADPEQGRAGVPERARRVRGHRHLLTFSHGPRTCLGKDFAIAELKVVLSVLVRDFVFELRDGVGTRIEASTTSLPWPRVAGEAGGKVPLRVTRYVG